MILENQRNRKLIELYRILTGSNLEGDIKDKEVISLLYAILHLDLTLLSPEFRNSNIIFKPNEYVLIAKEILRACELEVIDDFDNYKVMCWCRAMLRYMTTENVSYETIFKTSTYELRAKLINYIEVQG